MIDHSNMRYTFLIATYNRRKEIERAISSILLINNFHKFTYEIIIVDDSSSDATSEFIEHRFHDEIKLGILKYIRLNKNIGVTGARNVGIAIASGEWIVIVDSDDEIIPDVFNRVNEEVGSCGPVAGIFYRCIDFSGKLIGVAKSRAIFDAKDYSEAGLPGECLTIIRRSVISKIPFKESLRGFEGVTYLEILLSGKVFMLSELVLRRYCTGHKDQLSSWRGRLVRSNELSEGYSMQIDILKQHGLKVKFSLQLKKIVYRAIGAGYKFCKSS